MTELLLTMDFSDLVQFDCDLGLRHVALHSVTDYRQQIKSLEGGFNQFRVIVMNLR